MVSHLVLMSASWLAATLLFAAPAATAAEPARSDALYQYSTINALLHGLYDGDITFAGLSRRGDTGIGTFNGLDGEMIGLDGAFYRIRIDGRAYPVAAEARTPFAVVTFFDRDRTMALPADLDYAALQVFLEQRAGNPNHFQAIRIDGRFARIKVRSVPAQKPPYRPLAQVIEDQAVFEHTDIEGTLIGFRTPAYVQGLNVPGYHFHFIDTDRNRGGHVLTLTTGRGGTLAIDDMAEFDMALPDRPDFAATDLVGKRAAELDKVEKGR